MSVDDAHTLTATRRERIGSRYARRIRESGGLPAVIYGHKLDPVPITVDAHVTRIALNRGEKLFRIELDGGEPEFVLVKDLTFDHLGTHIVHVDFARVDIDERVVTHVHLELVGEAIGLKRAGAVLDHPVTELEIECSVFNLPDRIEVDISGLEAGHAMHARDVVLPKPTMNLRTDPDAVVARIELHGTEEATGEAAVVG